MPSASKVGWAQLRVGMTAIAALSLTGVLVYLLTGTTGLFTKQVTLYTYLGDAAAVAVGAPVRVNGINAGNVKAVALSGETAKERVVRVEMAVNEDMLSRIPIDSLATVTAENLLGSKFMNIKRGDSAVTVKDGATIAAKASNELFEMMDSFFPLLTSAKVTLDKIDGIISQVESGKGNIGKLLYDEAIYARVDSILAEFQKTLTAVNSGKGTASKLLYDDALYNDIRSPIQRIDRMLAGLEDGKGTAGKLLKDPAIYDEVQKNLVLMRRVLEDLQAGKGTAGKVLKSDELHTQIVTLIRHIDTTVEKINSGQGTLGQLLVNAQLYESLNGTTRELNGLLKDFRANPKKFLSIKLGLF
ncbi:MAG: MCE family protein [Candidatus Solibacter usitatus]|nr:MCE family protein [Candidatus Solibacter usitatus]